jgi:hypothetical protein
MMDKDQVLRNNIQDVFFIVLLFLVGGGAGYLIWGSTMAFFVAGCIFSVLIILLYFFMK